MGLPSSPIHNRTYPKINVPKVLSLAVSPVFPGLSGPYSKWNYPSKELLEWLIWNRVHNPDSTMVNLKVQLPGVSMRRWLKNYGIVDIRKEQTIWPEAYVRTPKALKKIRRLYVVKGWTCQKIARSLNCDPSTVVKACKDMGIFVSAIRDIDWTIPKSIPVNTIDNYKKYVHTIRTFTNRMYDRYKSIIDPSSLRGCDFVIDHKLSIYDAYNKSKIPMPWQLICHPANLELKPASINSRKSRYSDLSPTELNLRIKEFEVKHGKVFIPIVVGETTAGRIKYNKSNHDTIKDNIDSYSSFSSKTLRYLIKNPPKCLRKEKRKHFTRSHYSYILYAFIVQRLSKKSISIEIGVGQNQIKQCLDRIIGNFNPTRATIKSIRHLRYSEKKMIPEISKTLQLPMFEVACIFYRYVKG